MKIKGTLFILALTTGLSLAQAQEPKSNADPNRPRERGRFNYEDFRKQMNERLKTALKVTDEEWGVIQPLIEKVQTKLRDTMTSRFGGFGGSSRSDSSRSSDPSRPERAGTAEREALRTALENENSSPDELKAKLAAVRDVRKKSAAELADAREDLKKVLTIRQEAALVSFGILE